MTTTSMICAATSINGLLINGCEFDAKLPLERYTTVLGQPSRSIETGPPAPFGHRNNQIHVFDSAGVYLTEHHASRLIESANFIFDTADSPFPIGRHFCGDLVVGGQQFVINMLEHSLAVNGLANDLPGEYSAKFEKCWVGISAKGRRGLDGKRRKPRYVVRVSICF